MKGFFKEWKKMTKPLLIGIPEGKPEIVRPDLTRTTADEFEDDLPKVSYLLHFLRNSFIARNFVGLDIFLSC